MPRSFLIFPLIAGLIVASSAQGGPNEGGVVILHENESLTYSTDVEYCGESGLEVCPVADTRVDTPDPVVFFVLAAFPADGTPRLAGVTFGIEYEESVLFLLDWGSCGDYQLPTQYWPESGEGNAVTWAAAQTGFVTEIYWFAGYVPYGDPTEFRMTPNPVGGGDFADDDIPANLDPVYDYGILGFNTDGYLPCPDPSFASTLELVPSEIAVYQPCGGTFPVDLRVSEIHSLAAFEVCVGYDENYLGVDEVVIDPDFLGSTGRQVYPLPPGTCAPSCQSSGILIGAYTSGPEDPPAGSGRLATLRFSPRAAGGATDSLCLESWELTNSEIPPVILPLYRAYGLDITHSPYCFGDFNGDGDVTAFDLSQILPRWRCCMGDGCYAEARDVNLIERGSYCASTADGCIDVLDIQMVAGRWHQGCPGGRPEPESPAVRSTPWVSVFPEQSILSSFVGDTTSVALVVDDTEDLGAFEAGLSFDPAVIHVESIEIGSYFGSTGRTIYGFPPQIDNVTGHVRFGTCTVGESPGPDGNGTLTRIIFRIKACDTSTDLLLDDVMLTSTDGWAQELAGVDGGWMEIGCASDVPQLPELGGAALFTNHPNPLSSTTEITFSLPATAADGVPVQLEVFSADGRLVQRLLDQNLASGLHRVEWDARDDSGMRVPSGTYFCRLSYDGKVLKRPIRLVK